MRDRRDWNFFHQFRKIYGGIFEGPMCCERALLQFSVEWGVEPVTWYNHSTEPYKHLGVALIGQTFD